MRELLPVIDRWRAEKKRVALATVVKLYGSAPLPLGSKRAIASTGEMAGSVWHAAALSRSWSSPWSHDLQKRRA